MRVTGPSSDIVHLKARSVGRCHLLPKWLGRCACACCSKTLSLDISRPMCPCFRPHLDNADISVPAWNRPRGGCASDEGRLLASVAGACPNNRKGGVVLPDKQRVCASPHIPLWWTLDTGWEVSGSAPCGYAAKDMSRRDQARAMSAPPATSAGLGAAAAATPCTATAMAAASQWTAPTLWSAAAATPIISAAATLWGLRHPMRSRDPMRCNPCEPRFGVFPASRRRATSVAASHGAQRAKGPRGSLVARGQRRARDLKPAPLGPQHAACSKSLCGG